MHQDRPLDRLDHQPGHIEAETGSDGEGRLLELLEGPGEELGIDPGAVVLHPEAHRLTGKHPHDVVRRLRRSLPDADHHGGGTMGAGVLGQRHQQMHQPVGIGQHRLVGGCSLDLRRGRHRGHRRQQPAHRRGAEPIVEAAVLDPGHRQDVGDESHQPVAIARHVGENVVSLRGFDRSVLEQCGTRDETGQRGPQLVIDHHHEVAADPVGLLRQGQGALGVPASLIQLVVEALEFNGTFGQSDRFGLMLSNPAHRGRTRRPQGDGEKDQ